MKLLLDTTVLIDVLRGKGQGFQMVETFIRQKSTLMTSVINVAEVHAGLRQGEEARPRQLIGGMNVLPLTGSIAERGRQLTRTWARHGRTLSLTDMLVAATALEHGLTLATSNLKDFPMPEIELFRLT